MNSARILIVLLIILGLVIFGQRITNQSKNDVKSAADIKVSTLNTPTAVAIPTSTLTISPSPTNVPIATSTPTPSNPPSNQTLNISDFKYPNSIIINTNEDILELENADDPKKITDWYKDKIKNMNMNVTSFVQTSANGNVFNKLVGAKGKTKVEIEITKQNDSQTVKISISLIS